MLSWLHELSQLLFPEQPFPQLSEIDLLEQERDDLQLPTVIATRGVLVPIRRPVIKNIYLEAIIDTFPFLQILCSILYILLVIARLYRHFLDCFTLDVKFDMYHVAILYFIVLPFGTNLTYLLELTFRTIRKKVLTTEYISANKSFFKI